MQENNKTIREQEIKEAIKEIAHETEHYEEDVKNIQKILNPEIQKDQEGVEKSESVKIKLLEKLVDEVKKEHIELLYNREHLTSRLLTELREKHLLSEENKILGKMVLEIVLKYSK